MASGRFLAYWTLAAALDALVASDDKGEACRLDGDYDEAGLLQLATAREAGLIQLASPQTPAVACMNGGRLVQGTMCICNPGWSGPRCEVPEESQPYDPSDVPLPKGQQGPLGDTICDMTFKVFPYGEEKLWGTAYQGWETCDAKQQSPIDIDTSKTATVTSNVKLDTNYGLPTGSIGVVNNGHALQVEGHFGSVVLGGITYESQQFHFHNPSEHRVNGKQAALEMHIVNTANGSIAVVGIMFDIGAENTCLKEAFQGPPKAGCVKSIQPIDLGKCFASQLAGPWWSYSGSLTTPPCSEGVRWNVMKNRATISRQQLKELEKRYTNNARMAKPLNYRKVFFQSVK